MDLKKPVAPSITPAGPTARLHHEMQQPVPDYYTRAIALLDLMMEYYIPCEVIPRLEEYPATWHPSRFMVFRLNPRHIIGEPVHELGTLRLHIWPAGLRQGEHRGYGPSENDGIWDGDIHNHAWRVNSYVITGYQDWLFDVRLVGQDMSQEEIDKNGYYRMFQASYLGTGEDALIANGNIVEAIPRELRDYLGPTDLHEIAVADFHAPCIPHNRLAATLALNSHRISPLGPDILIRGSTGPIVGARRPVTRDEALEAKAQLLAVPHIRAKQRLVARSGSHGAEVLTLTELDLDIQADIALAEKIAHEEAFPADKMTKFGAVLTADNGRYTGTNIKRWSWNSTTCAERMALDQAQAGGVTGIKRVVIYGSTAGQEPAFPMPPCGSCRELLKEVAHQAGQRAQDIPLFLVGPNKGRIVMISLANLLPFSDVLTISEGRR